MNDDQRGDQNVRLLPNGTRLHRNYTIKDTLASDAFGSTYEALDEREKRYVAILEYYPKSVSIRTEGSLAIMPKNRSCGALFFLGTEAFQNQHRALMRIAGSPNVSAVYDVFCENGTAYAVTELLQGATLSSYLTQRKQLLTAGECMLIAASMADALLVVHSVSTLHYAIHADSVFLCSNGRVKLTGFGAARYALMNQCEPSDADPWIDIGALGETLYTAMCGRKLDKSGIPRSCDRIPQSFYELFCRMLAQSGSGRLTNVFEYRHALACVDVQAEGFDTAYLVTEAYRAPQAAPEQSAYDETETLDDHASESGKAPRKARANIRLLLTLAAVLIVLGVLACVLAVRALLH